MAGFLIIAGLTGTLLVWYNELDTRLNMQMMRIEPSSVTSQPMSPFELRDVVAGKYPKAMVNWMTLQAAIPNRAVRFSLEPITGITNDFLEFDEVFVNPYNGEILGGREWGNITQGTTNLMPFIYRLHYSLTLDSVGVWIMGIIALLWTLDCFVGAYLTLPRRRKDSVNIFIWFKRWQPTWKVRWRSNLYKLNYDLHTAASLWLWTVLFIFALSSVAMSLYSEVYKPVLSNVMAFQAIPLSTVPILTDINELPDITWEDGYKSATVQAEVLAEQQGFKIERYERFSYSPEKNMLKLMFTSNRDINQRFGQSWLYVDATSGELKGFYLPTGQAAGDTFTSWITTLHIAGIWGLPYRIFVTIFGLFVVILCVTGLVLWRRKQQAREKMSLAGLHNT